MKMKKWMMAIAIACAVVMNAQAAMVQWMFDLYDDVVSEHHTGTLYLFALGHDESALSFGEGSFNFNTLQLTSLTVPTAVFSPENADSHWWMFVGSSDNPDAPGRECVYGGISVSVDPQTINQWWAGVLISDDALDRFFIDVFQVDGLSEHSSGWIRNLLSAPVPIPEDHPWFVPEDERPDGMRIEYPFNNINFAQYAAIPEPLTTGLALAGVALLLAQRRRKS